MIRYSLKCSQGHEFESWFAGSEAYEKLAAAGQVACPQCGCQKIIKVLMAPSVAGGEPEKRDLAPAEQLRAEIEANSEDVGKQFAHQARAMHEGDIPKRQIHGEANAAEARALLEDGVPVLPLPFVPKSKAH